MQIFDKCSCIAVKNYSPIPQWKLKKKKKTWNERRDLQKSMWTKEMTKDDTREVHEGDLFSKMPWILKIQLLSIESAMYKGIWLFTRWEIFSWVSSVMSH